MKELEKVIVFDQVKLAELKPDDILVVCLKEHSQFTSLEDFNRFRDRFKEIFPNNKALILENGMTLEVYREKDE